MAPQGSPTPAGLSTLAGIGLMCLAVTSFALTDATAKWLSGHMNVLMVVWARYAIQFAASLVVFNPWTVPGLLRTTRPWLQLGRSALLYATTAMNFAALQYLQLDQTVSIMFSTPFFVALMAGPLLGEWVGARRWIAILVGFAGILLVVQPGAGGIHPAALLSLAAAATYALYSIATRMLAPHDPSPTTLFYSALVGTIAASLPLPFVWETPHEPLVYGGMLFLGVIAGAGHFVLILAHARAPAATLAPFIYTQIIAMVALGWLLFGQVPSLWTLAGAAVVISSGIYLILRERKLHRRPS
ncbi:DMT family transporter [Xanthobacter tagetidis]|jgi:drug/metabolite transporter (DMT)-like permease|uniref:DMT family transporter n=1 Tax=Xanthobacter tagetidis TaxID=60216 RepID=A0A3L7A7H5_9HYPH|nr:DMT family transporter [Xanthobacter tagetidis]MBB6308417.1 drug/metabolite transporter (DMT)-like permease [Xanthobacter tagetidis]RLP76279.1 DMT family transporter [Xanthobacter tagetidis]